MRGKNICGLKIGIVGILPVLLSGGKAELEFEQFVWRCIFMQRNKIIGAMKISNMWKGRLG